ncbi:unnamed protein product [Rhizophagus irregularis]|nr:unnamed protein product [Rhizophagus irregularis]
MLPKISQYTKALRSKKLFFDQEKTVRQGYHFDYNYGNLEESTLEILRLWPTDEKISQTMKHSHHLAVELAEFLGMLQPADISPDLNSLQILISIHEEEVSTSDRKNQSENDKEQDENDETDFSAAITEASHEMRRISTEGNNEENLSNLFQEGCSQLTLIDQVSEDLSTLYNGDSINLGFQYGSENNLDFEILLQQRQRHEAYTSKPLERRFRTVSKRPDTSANIQPNKASHFVAYFTKNENPEQRFVTQREKRWKENRRNVSITLAQLHAEELTAQLKKKKKVTNKKAQHSHIQIPNIENANISKDFPLIKGDYVFVIYGDQIDLTREECNLLTHHLASNIVYHIGPTNVLIEENVLKLLGNEKQYYYDYFGRKDIIEKIQ